MDSILFIINAVLSQMFHCTFYHVLHSTYTVGEYAGLYRQQQHSILFLMTVAIWCSINSNCDTWFPPVIYQCAQLYGARSGPAAMAIFANACRKDTCTPYPHERDHSNAIAGRAPNPVGIPEASILDKVGIAVLCALPSAFLIHTLF
jgi:hypothetical protein